MSLYESFSTSQYAQATSRDDILRICEEASVPGPLKYIKRVTLLKVSKGAKIRNRYSQYQWDRDKLTFRHQKRG